MNLEKFWAAMYVSEIWYSLFKDVSAHLSLRTYGRCKSLILYDRIMADRI